ncbi:extracellular solute-binding protein [Paenibacillus sp. ACRRX]|uniref:ABC transporter substrate-binding protein n=1 Tax=Paenibacillus sp. ACRRX TaxID=2918206 RepID=UPI001EF5C46D|nr:extracellular solute-binding protein [Paenibacillus sp. ACRRX]MCG7407816.1 extracellular solute-binding protein [Paenibacillus sp. ACRRX]
MPSTKNTLIVVILIFITLLLMSEFGGHPIFMNTLPKKEARQLEQVVPDSTMSPRQLRVEVGMSPLAFTKLRKLNEAFMKEHGILVDLVNRDTTQIRSALPEEFQLQQSADVVLVESEMVNRYAVKGWLLPNDSDTSWMEAGPEWIGVYTRWNGLMWGFPAYVDPYVLVWNKDKLQAATGLDMPPSTLKEWHRVLNAYAHSKKLHAGSGDTDQRMKTTKVAVDKDAQPLQFMFAWQGDDDYALLSLLWRLGIVFPDTRDRTTMSREAAQQTVDGVRSGSVSPTSREQDTKGATVKTNTNTSDTEQIEAGWQARFEEWDTYKELFHEVSEQEKLTLWDELEAGNYLFAIVPYSTAMLQLKEPFAIEDPEHIASPYSHWVRSSSYVISAHSELPEDAKKWIAFMTQVSIQQDILESVSLLPADRKAVEQVWPLMSRRIPRMFDQDNPSLKLALQRTTYIEKWLPKVKQWLHGRTSLSEVQTGWKEVWIDNK